MKVHWGAGIVVTFVLFTAALAVMVTISMRENIDLVADDYYDLELRHQEQIERSRRTAAMGDSLSILVTPSEVRILFPASAILKPPSGTLNFYRPSDRKMDFALPLSLDADAAQNVALSSLGKGLWKLKLAWTHDGDEYYAEETIVVQ